MNRPAHAPSRSFKPERLAGPGNRILLMIVGLCVLVVLGVTAALIQADRDNAIHDAEQRNSVLTQVLEEHARRAFDLSKISLEDLSRDLMAEDRPHVTAALSARMAQWLNTNPLIASYWLIDGAGSVIHTTQQVNTKDIDFSDREYFKAHARGEDIHIGQMTLGRLDGRWFFSLSKRLTDKSGAFRGVLLASMRPDYFSSLYTQLGLGPTDNIGIYRRDGAVVARRLQEWSGAVAPTNAASSLFTTHLPKSPSGVYRSTSPIDGVERILAYRSLDGWPLIVASGSSIDGVLGAWRSRSYRNAAYGGALLVSLAVLGVWGTRTQNKQRALEEATLRTTNEARRAAERANVAKSRFLAAASHDLRQPLQALSLYLGVLAEKAGPDSAGIIERMERCMSGLNSLLSDLLDLSKLDAGAVVPTVSDFAITDLLKAAVAANTPAAEAKGVRVRMLASNVTARTDPVLFGRMIGNLVSNAVRYTEHGGVVIGCRRRNGKVWVEVWDTGIGFPEERTDEIFEEFQQLANHERSREKGSGLGLAIVRKATILLGLEIRVASRPGRGSMFAVELPQGQKPALTVGHPATAAVPTLRVALVEDDAAVRDALVCTLESGGHQVVAASAVKELMSRLGNHPPDVVIADHRLAGEETGLDAVVRVRERFDQSVPAVILTGDTDPVVVRELMAKGIRVAHKPLSPDALRVCLLDVMERSTAGSKES